MISLYKLNTPGQFLFIKFDILGQHSVGIDTAFATKSDTPTHNLGVLVQANVKCFPEDGLQCNSPNNYIILSSSVLIKGGTLEGDI